MATVPDPFIHPSAIVEEGAILEPGAKVWHFAHVRTRAHLREGVSLGKDVFVDEGVEIGPFSRVQNGVSIYRGVNIEPYVFVGPHVIFTNDLYPRAGKKAWALVETYLRTGCSIGAGTVICCGAEVGAFSLVGSGSIVTTPIPPFHLAVGLPAKPIKQICACGNTRYPIGPDRPTPFCEQCKDLLPPELYRLADKIYRENRQHGAEATL